MLRQLILRVSGASTRGTGIKKRADILWRLATYPFLTFLFFFFFTPSLGRSWPSALLCTRGWQLPSPFHLRPAWAPSGVFLTIWARRFPKPEALLLPKSRFMGNNGEGGNNGE